MATIISNDKNFKIIKLSFNDRIELGWGDICMHCNEVFTNNMYYVAVLNDIMCKKCYEEWYKTAINYPEDRNIEDNLFRNVLDRLDNININEYVEDI